MFLGYIQSFRALAIFFIVAGHSIDVFSWPDNSSLEKILRILMSNGTVLFVFIAGYLFQHLSKKFNIHKYYLTKFKYVLTPYFLISIPAILIFVTILERESVWQGFYENPLWFQVISFYLTGKHLAPLWFIPMITLFYILAPVLIKLDKSKYIYFFLPLFIILSCFIPRSGLPYTLFVHFFSVYLLGMFCSHYKDSINQILSKYSTILILFILVCCFALIEFYLMNHTMTYVNYLQKTTMSLLLLGIFIRLGDKIKSDFIETAANTSFGIFFIHSYILTSSKMLLNYFDNALTEGNIIGYILTVTLTLLICMAIIQFTKYIFGANSRYLVGS